MGRFLKEVPLSTEGRLRQTRVTLALVRCKSGRTWSRTVVVGTDRRAGYCSVDHGSALGRLRPAAHLVKRSAENPNPKSLEVEGCSCQADSLVGGSSAWLRGATVAQQLRAFRRRQARSLSVARAWRSVKATVLLRPSSSEVPIAGARRDYPARKSAESYVT